jgi:glyoxylase-like metal-dependent hydrolase (beta-lactamase superfamily II)
VWLQLPGSWGETNIGLVVGHGASLLIDTPWDPGLTRRALAAFAPHTERAPITLLVNTHPDVDHWWGNAQVRQAEVLAAEAAARAMRDEPPPARMLALRRLSELTGRMPARAGTMGRYVAAMLAPIALSEVELRFPDRTFADRQSESVGGRDVEVIELGAAHTASDAVVLVPDARVVYAGDLLFSGVTPVMWHGPVSAWIEAIDRLTALEADVFVPGHGPVASRRELAALRDYWGWLADAAAGGRAAGVEPFELCRQLTSSAEFAGFRAWQNPERLFVNVVNIDRQLRGLEPLGHGPVDRARAFDGVARLADHLAR